MKKFLFFLLLMTTVCLIARSAQEVPNGKDGLQSIQNSKVDIPIPYNRVHRAGLLWMNTTNMGWYGNPDAYKDPCTGQTAISGEMPGGSGTDYLFAGALLFGGYLDSATVNVGAEAKVFQGPLVSTAYEGWSGSPMPKEMWPINFDNDPSGAILGQINETSNVEGKVNCLFENVYDPAATAEEQFNTMYSDKFVLRNPYTGMDEYDLRDHIPLGIEVRQKSYAWSYDYAEKFIIVDYTLYSRNLDGKDIYDFFMGMYLDCDIGMHSDWAISFTDDISGFIQKWDNYIDPATGEQKTIDLNLAWAADNDGRDYVGQDAGSPLNGATGVITVKVLRNPNPNLRYAYNMYIAASGDESGDWGPHWETGLHSDWMYDLTPNQKGYDDTNYDGLFNGGVPLAGGRVEGRPAGDKGKYMVMSNDEFDYNQYDLIDVDLGRYSDPSYMQGTQYAQADKWQMWFDPSEALPGPDYVYDGDLEDRNDIANGADSKYILSFGPLGSESYTNTAIDSDLDGVLDDYINKKVWKFAYGDSLKLTLAFIVNENFHTSLDQDPNYVNDALRDPPDGLDPSLYDKGWYDALYNVVWCERMYDIPMYDTPVNKYGEIKGDGWYGEDVGVDGVFAASSVTECWWTDPATQYGGPDEGESNFELDDFTSFMTDTYGYLADSEDNLLPFGREIEDENFGTTEEYGYLTRYDNYLDPYPGVTPGQWVRYGFDNGKIDVGDGVPDFRGPPPPPSPKIEVYFDNNDVVIEWASKEFYELQGGIESYFGPELFVDPFSRVQDFESYTVKISPNSNVSNFIDLLTIDKVNYAYQNVADMGDFLDAPVSAQEIADSLASGNPFPPIITLDGKIWELTPYGDNRSLIGNYNVPNVFEYISTPVSIVINGTETIDYYQYSLRLYNKYLDNIEYVGVVATDYGDPKSGMPSSTSSLYSNMSKVKGIEEDETVLPFATELYQNYPNPFNPETKINFSLNKDSKVKLTIYNVAGQMVKQVIDEELTAGFHSKIFNADNLNSGIYYYTLKTENNKISKKMVLVK
ncbi:MAG: T9SS type A sorting domain-containing protein [Candidatus Delongbacteria bacterium]|nr:T9SS type A sorting domain-containing protein [Candidatus Delongbacteria bacterium]